jgi:hypothetical protein
VTTSLFIGRFWRVSIVVEERSPCATTAQTSQDLGGETDRSAGVDQVVDEDSDLLREPIRYGNDQDML